MALNVKRVKRAAGGLAITSLMDALTIILFFLMMNYSEETGQEEPPKFVTLPIIEAGELTSNQNKIKTAKVMIGKNQFELNKKTYRYRSPEDIVQRLPALLAYAKKHNLSPKTGPNLAVAADKDVPYAVIDAVLVSAAMQGITNIEFIALRKQN